GGDGGEHQDPELDGAAGELVDGGDRGRERVVDRRRVALAGAQLVDRVGQRGDRRVGAVGGGRPLPVLPDGRLPQALGGVGHRAGGDLVGGEQRRVAGGGVAADGGLGLDDRLGEQRGVDQRPRRGAGLVAGVRLPVLDLDHREDDRDRDDQR